MAFPTTLDTHPVGVRNPAIVRTYAALPAASAWDAAPIEIACTPMAVVMFYMTYLAGDGGTVDFYIEVSPFHEDHLTLQSWYQMSLYAAGAMVAGTDIFSDIQREVISYQAVGANAEMFVYGPIELSGGVERIRLVAREVVAAQENPGSFGVVAVFYIE